MGTLAELPNLKVSLNFCCCASPIRQKCPLTELIEKLLYHEDNVKKGPPIKKYDSNILSNLKFLIYFSNCRGYCEGEYKKLTSNLFNVIESSVFKISVFPELSPALASLLGSLVTINFKRENC